MAQPIAIKQILNILYHSVCVWSILYFNLIIFEKYLSIQKEMFHQLYHGV
jgi:hypothetical protein